VLVVIEEGGLRIFLCIQLQELDDKVQRRKQTWQTRPFYTQVLPPEKARSI
jgi:hypothetical protein